MKMNESNCEEKLEPMVIEELRKMYYLREKDGMFEMEIYADYQDEMDGVTAGEIIDSEHPMDVFYDRLLDWYSQYDYLDELVAEVINSINKRGIRLNEDDEEFVSDYVYDNVRFFYPANHYLDQDLYVNIMLDTGDMNYDFTLNSVYPCWYGNRNERIDDLASIVWLAKNQGYTKTQLWTALKDGDTANPKGFLQSMRVELANLPSHMSTLTFLVKMSFGQLIELNNAIKWRERQVGKKYDPNEYPNCGFILLGKETMCGLYDPWDGGGSVLEIQLEKDVKIPIKYIWKAIPDEAKGHGYSVGDVYGMCGSAWKETLKEMHFPQKMKEAC